jgi:adhesin transport system outer membrane protein
VRPRCLAFALLALAAGTGGHAATVTLPPPGGDPQHIDFSRDPVLAFSRTTAPSRPFLDLLGAAVSVHPAVLAAIADSDANQGVRTQVRAGLFPQINAQIIGAHALARDFSTQTTVVESLTPRGRTDASLTGDQLLYDFGATGSRIAAADDRVRAARAEIERIAGETELRAVSAWYDVLGYQTLAEISAGSAARQRAILADVRIRVAQGVGADGDSARVEAVLADTEAQTARYQRLLDQARARYREAFGNAPPARLDRSAPPASQAHSGDAAAVLARQSPGVVVALRLAEAARRTARAARADGLPRLSAGINATRYNVFTGNSDYEVRGTIMLRQSLFAGGRQRGIIAETRAQERSAGFAADRIAGETERDAAAAFTDVDSLSRTQVMLETAYVANRRARDAYVEQFRVSRGSLIELLRAEQDFAAAATACLQGFIELDIARYALLARTGEILDATGVKLTTTL